VLASNTSSLLVTAIAAAARNPERVVGMHFFNPAPLMRLLEVVAGVESSTEALALATATGEAMGKTVIVAKDGPGFLVNRCNRPFGLEALHILQEQIADIETIDRTMRVEGGFRMGPFELMDLVGVDTGLEISKSFYEQSFGEPRWRPSPIAARYVAAGLHGRKSGRGYYDYSRDPYRDPDPAPASPVGGGTADATVRPADGGGVDGTVRPTTGGVLERILCQVINECAFALGEGVGSAEDIDVGMVLGLSYPRGPLAWADGIGLDRVLAVLDRLWEEYREERYRPAPALRDLVRAGRLGRASGAGFFAYDAAP
jgi:3-hydroxybutyryl-CoA dehydrogenase